MRARSFLRSLLVLSVVMVARASHAAAAAPAPAAAPAADWKLDSDTFEGLRARSLGPGVMSGRISCIDGVSGTRNTLWVGTAGGGVWRSRDDGTTWAPLFDRYTMSIGAIRVAPSNPKVVWVGTGESWARNSVGYGDGVYKTTDDGDSWTRMGLEKTERIARIAIDPAHPDTVLVAALGPLFNDSPERGIYRTIDGGRTWTRTLYVDPRTGGADLAIDPKHPEIVFASMWSVRRQAWTFASGGPGSGLYKSADGGRTWRRLTAGLPAGDLGRIAIAISPVDPRRVYAVVESKKNALYRSDDAGEHWQRENESSTDVTWRPFYFGHLVADPLIADRVYKGGLNLSATEDGGRTFTTVGRGQGGPPPYHSDLHAVWVDPRNTEFLVIGTDGGVYLSTDRGNTWRPCENLPVGQFYHVSYDMRTPYCVYGGLQDNGTWTAPSTRSGGVPNRMWETLLGGDGFWAFPDARDQDVAYCEYQGGHLSRVRLSTGETKDVQPLRGAGDPRLRFNWNAPLHVGPSGNLYMGSQFLYRTRDQGDTWDRISGDLTTNDPAKLQQDKSGGLSVDNSSAENHCTIYAIGESPRDSNVVWVGTDDGNVQVTRDGGHAWTNVTRSLGIPACTWISYVSPSPHDVATCFVTADGHMLGDFAPHVLVTHDFGRTWTVLPTGGMQGYAHVVRQDPVNPELLFAGTEWGLYASLDGGRQWAQVHAGIPNVAVRDLAIQPREGDLLVATHGRGIYVIDDLSPLRSLTRDKLASDAAFLVTRPGVLAIPRQEQRFAGSAGWAGDELPEAAIITYYLKKRHLMGDLKLEIFDESGRRLSTIAGGRRRGINRVEWPMRLPGPKLPPAANLVPNQYASVGPRAAAGVYTAKLTRNHDVLTTTFTLAGDPRATHTAADRAEQVKVVNRLYARLADLTYAVESVQALRDSARARAQELPAKDALAKRLTALADRLEAMRGTMVAAREGGRLTGEERLREQLGDLYGKVNGYDGRPTNGQIALAGVLDGELQQAESNLDALLAHELPAVNAGLAAHRRPAIGREARESWNLRTDAASRGSGGLELVRELFGGADEEPGERE